MANFSNWLTAQMREIQIKLDFIKMQHDALDDIKIITDRVIERIGQEQQECKENDINVKIDQLIEIEITAQNKLETIINRLERIITRLER